MSSRFVHLDMMRGLAALAVACGHIRGFLFVDFSELTAPGLTEYIFYFATSLGHQAVIAFFALSGYLVGGKMLQQVLQDRFSPTNYAIARLSRLWVVVIPALLLTYLMDTIGANFGFSAGYEGALSSMLSSGPSIDQPADYSFSTLVANVLFLQTITSPVYGANGPFWSLSYEFWYYVTFPIGALALFGCVKIVARVALVLAFLLFGIFLPLHMVILGVVWLAGAVACMLEQRFSDAGLFQSGWYASASFLVLMVALGASAVYAHIVFDIALGLACASFLPALVNLKSPHHWYASFGFGLSEVSFSLYAIHFPIVAALFFIFLAPNQQTLNLESFVTFSAFVGLSLVASSVFWWCFERNTPIVREAVTGFWRKLGC